MIAEMRRSEVKALLWADIDSTDGDGMLITVRRSETNPKGEVNDVCFAEGGVARHPNAARRYENPDPGDW